MKSTRATRYIVAAAQRSINGGVTVELDRSYSTVAMGIPGSESGCFMQGDDAENFIAEVDALCRRYPSLSDDIAALALAEPYAECFAN